MDYSFVKLNRKILNTDWFKIKNCYIVFSFILIKANWKDEVINGFPLNRGQARLSFQSISDGTGVSVQGVRTAINKLVGFGSISYVSYKNFSVFTILNYSKYQGNQQTDDTPQTLVNTGKNTKNKKLLTNKTACQQTNQQTNQQTSQQTNQQTNQQTKKTPESIDFTGKNGSQKNSSNKQSNKVNNKQSNEQTNKQINTSYKNNKEIIKENKEEPDMVAIYNIASIPSDDEERPPYDFSALWDREDIWDE